MLTVDNDTSTDSSNSSVTSIERELARRVTQDTTSLSKATSLLMAPTDVFGDPFCDNDSDGDDVTVVRESTDAVVQALITNTKAATSEPSSERI